jgi:hypothetical protein
VSEKCLLFWLKIRDVVDSLGCITWTMMCWSIPKPVACLPRPNSWPSSVGLARVGKDTEGQWSAAQDCGYTSWCYWNCEFLPPIYGINTICCHTDDMLLALGLLSNRFHLTYGHIWYITSSCFVQFCIGTIKDDFLGLIGDPGGAT